jgi:UDP-N-acetylmuramoyl-L-alanyl-D-glutamate--2,6-diaminopimelate ligase
MGQIAEAQADVVWLTSDNNRSESFAAISTEVLSGMRHADRVQVMADRAQAIRTAIAAMHPGDVVLIAGKGHERFQEEQGQRQPFSDLAQVQALLEGDL